MEHKLYLIIMVCVLALLMASAAQPVAAQPVAVVIHVEPIALEVPESTKDILEATATAGGVYKKFFSPT